MRRMIIAVTALGLGLSLGGLALAAAPGPQGPVVPLPPELKVSLDAAIAQARYKGDVTFEYHCMSSGQKCPGSVELLARVDVRLTKTVETRMCGAGSMPTDRCYRVALTNPAEQNLWEIDLDARPPAELPLRLTMTAKPAPAAP